MSRLQPIVEFSQLENDEKQRYIDFLLNNNVTFTVGQQNDFVAKIKIFTDRQKVYKQNENHDPQQRVQSKSLSKIYVLAKKNSKSNSLKEKENMESFITQTPCKKLLNTTILPLEELYPEFYKNIKAIDIWMRPKKLSKGFALNILYVDQLMQQIEDIYFTQFLEATSKISTRKSQSHIQNATFSQLVYQQIRCNYKNDRLAAQRSIDLLASLEYHAVKHLDVQIFQKFLNQTYLDQELMFFLFIRAIIEKEFNISIYNQIRKIAINLSSLQLKMKQIRHIVMLLYGSEKDQQIKSIIQLCEKKMIDSQSVEAMNERLTCLDFIDITLTNYYENRQLQPSYHQIMQILNSDLKFSQTNISLQNTKKVEQIPKDNNQEIRSMIYKEVSKQLLNFLKESVESTYMMVELQGVVDDLLQAIFQYDKMIWFKRIQVSKPLQNDLLYIENLQKYFRLIQKTDFCQLDLQEIHVFSKRIMQTPQLAKTIGIILLRGQQQF